MNTSADTGCDSGAAELVAAAAGTTESLEATQDDTKVVRTYRVIDFTKLKKAGLDREIVEAVKKYEVENPRTEKIVRRKPVASSSKLAKTNKETFTKRKYTKIVPPKITITRPMESYTEEESHMFLNSPNKTERLAHVKYLLNKKILNKTVNSQPTTFIIEPNNTATNITSKNLIAPEKQKITLKPPIASYGNSVPIVKTPDDVSRLLHFDTTTRSGTSAETSPPPAQKILNFSNKMPTLPNPGLKKRAEYKPATFKESFQNFVKQQNKLNQNFHNQAHIPQPNTDKMKQINRVVSVTPVIYKSESHILPGPISFPEVSPLKAPFPTTSLTCDTPLPTISTFKTCFPLNSQTEIFGQFQHPTTFSNFVPISNSSTAESENNLIVLEDKVLTQDEKIDITTLGLAKQNIEVPSVEFKQPPLPAKSRNLQFSNGIMLPESIALDGKSKPILQIQDIEFLPLQDTQIIKIIDDKVLTPNFTNEVKKDEEHVFKNVEEEQKSIPENESLPLRTESVPNIIILDSVKLNNLECPKSFDQENQINIEDSINSFDEKSTLTVLSFQESTSNSYKSKQDATVEHVLINSHKVENTIDNPSQIVKLNNLECLKRLEQINEINIEDPINNFDEKSTLTVLSFQENSSNSYKSKQDSTVEHVLINSHKVENTIDNPNQIVKLNNLECLKRLEQINEINIEDPINSFDEKSTLTVLSCQESSSNSYTSQEEPSVEAALNNKNKIESTIANPGRIINKFPNYLEEGSTSIIENNNTLAVSSNPSNVNITEKMNSKADSDDKSELFRDDHTSMEHKNVALRRDSSSIESNLNDELELWENTTSIENNRDISALNRGSCSRNSNLTESDNLDMSMNSDDELTAVDFINSLTSVAVDFTPAELNLAASFVMDDIDTDVLLSPKLNTKRSSISATETSSETTNKNVMIVKDVNEESCGNINPNGEKYEKLVSDNVEICEYKRDTVEEKILESLKESNLENTKELNKISEYVTATADIMMQCKSAIDLFSDGVKASSDVRQCAPVEVSKEPEVVQKGFKLFKESNIASGNHNINNISPTIKIISPSNDIKDGISCAAFANDYVPRDVTNEHIIIVDKPNEVDVNLHKKRDDVFKTSEIMFQCKDNKDLSSDDVLETKSIADKVSNAFDDNENENVHTSNIVSSIKSKISRDDLEMDLIPEKIAHKFVLTTDEIIETDSNSLEKGDDDKVIEQTNYMEHSMSNLLETDNKNEQNKSDSDFQRNITEINDTELKDKEIKAMNDNFDIKNDKTLIGTTTKSNATDSSALKRPSRLKKGKINLVQRKKISTQTKPAAPKLEIEPSTPDEEVVSTDISNKLNVFSSNVDTDFEEMINIPQKNLYNIEENSFRNKIHSSDIKSSQNDKTTLLLSAVKDPPKHISVPAQNPFKCIDKEKPGPSSLLKNLQTTESKICSNSNINIGSNMDFNKSEINTTEKETAEKKEMESKIRTNLETLDKYEDTRDLISDANEIVSEKRSNDAEYSLIINEPMKEESVTLLNEEANIKDTNSICDPNCANITIDNHNDVKEKQLKDCTISNLMKQDNMNIEEDISFKELVQDLHKTIESEIIILSEKDLAQDQTEYKEKSIDIENLKNQALENNESSKQNFKRSYFECYNDNEDEANNSSDDVTSKQFEKKSRIERHKSYVSSDDNSFNNTTGFEDTSPRQLLTKNRKRLRKTHEQLNKNIICVISESDDDKESRDDDDFLGFEELSSPVECVNKRSDIINNSLFDHLGLKDNNSNDNNIDISKKVQIPQTIVNSIPKGNISTYKKMKKRWELQQQPSSETDITDDTSPADDECDDNLNIKTKHYQNQMVIGKHFQKDLTLNLNSVVKESPVDSFTNSAVQELTEQNYKKKNFESTDQFSQSFDDLVSETDKIGANKSEVNIKIDNESNQIPAITDSAVIECGNASSNFVSEFKSTDSVYVQDNTENNKVVSCNETVESDIQEYTENLINEDNLSSKLTIKENGEIKKKRGRKRKYIELSDKIYNEDVSKNSLKKTTIDTIRNDYNASKPITEKTISIQLSENVETSSSFIKLENDKISTKENVSDQSTIIPTLIENPVSDRSPDSNPIIMEKTTNYTGSHPDISRAEHVREREFVSTEISVVMNLSQSTSTSNIVTKKKRGRPKLISKVTGNNPDNKIDVARNLHLAKVVFTSEDKDSISNSETDISDKSKTNLTSIENPQNSHASFDLPVVTAKETISNKNISNITQLVNHNSSALMSLELADYEVSKSDHSLEQENEKSALNSMLDLLPAKCGANVATKKKRGRPKLISIQAETFPSNNYIPNKNLSVKEQKKRGRPTKVSVEQILSSNDESKNKGNNDTSIEVVPQSQLSNSSLADSSIPNQSPKVIQKKKRGRPSKIWVGEDNKNDTLKNENETSTEASPQGESFNPRLLLIRTRDELESDTILTAPEDSNIVGTIQCGLCLGKTTKKNWIQHLCEHYGVGWIQGENKINVRSRSIVMSTMINFYKKEAIQALNCRMCSRSYRSALGLLMHIEVCGLNAIRVTCEYCNREYSKFTLTVHIRSCSRRFGESNPSKEQEKKKEKEEVFNNVGRLKRTSLMKAEKKLKAIGEEFKNSALELNEKNFKNYLRYEPSIKEHEEILADKFNVLDVVKCPAKTCVLMLKREQIKEHLSVCHLLPKSGYHCLMCTNVLFTREDAIKHVISLHKNDLKLDFEDDGSNCSVKSGEEPSDDDDCSSGVNSDEYNDEGDSVKSISLSSQKLQSKERKNPRIVINKRVYPQRSSDPSALVKYKWKQFASKNFTELPLYTDASPSYTISSETNIKNRLPSQETSMKFAVSDKERFMSALGTMEHGEWMDLKRFESTNFNNEHLINIGGPVKMIAWAPLPKHIQEQYFAVIYRKSMDKFTRYLNGKVNPTFILIYQIKQEAEVVNSKLCYAININDGPVHCFSFLPSGGYDESTNRLGLLAVGGIKNEINIYSLPLQLTTDINSEFNIIDLKPSLVLYDNHPDDESNNDNLKTQCLQICWSQAIGHNHIFASFLNGCIGIWDIDTDEKRNINSFKKNGVNMFVPLNYFFVGERIIHGLDMHYDTSGPRWLAIACAQRKLIVFDIRDLTQPIILKEENLKNLIRSLDWPLVWETVNVGLCDSLPGYGCTAVAISPINICYSNCRIDNMLCGIGQIHYNPNINIQVCGADNGDIVFLNVRELHLDDILQKTLQNSRAVATMDIKCLDSAITIPKCINTEWELYEKDYKNRYGLVFGPILKYKPVNKSSYLNKDRIPKLNMLRYTQINAMRWNINPNRSKLLAVGYENGFLRLINFNKKTYFQQ